MTFKLPELPDGVKAEDYWIIHAKGQAWYFLMSKVAKSVDLEKIPDKEMAAIVLFTADGSPIYMFKRKFFPIDEIKLRTGLSTEYLNKEKVITLIETAKKGLPEATVSYWGEA